tara:strand:+ start:632 stop:1123 length:492 start_codon:yes stop_codon:yes gene_type:complete
MNLDIGKGMCSILFVLIIIFIGLLRNPVETFMGGPSSTDAMVNSSMISKLLVPLWKGIFAGLPAMSNVARSVTGAMGDASAAMDPDTKYVAANSSRIFDQLMGYIYKVPELESRILSLENRSTEGGPQSTAAGFSNKNDDKGVFDAKLVDKIGAMVRGTALGV